MKSFPQPGVLQFGSHVSPQVAFPSSHSSTTHSASLAQSPLPFGQGTGGPPQNPLMQTGERAGEGLSLQSASLEHGRCGPPQKPFLQTPSAAQSASLVHLPVVAPGGTVPLPAQLMFTLQLSQPVIRQPPPAAWAPGLVSQPSLSLAFASSHSSIGTHGKQS